MIPSFKITSHHTNNFLKGIKLQDGQYIQECQEVAEI